MAEARADRVGEHLDQGTGVIDEEQLRHGLSR
jgi:hypothetical protein